jgi:hypothetical protein
MLEALAAVNRTPLSRLEGDRGLLPTLRTNRLGFNSLNACRTVPVALGARGFARLATLRLVFEAFVGEKHLLAGGEDEFRTAVGTLQDPIMVFHTLLRTRAGEGRQHAPQTTRPRPIDSMPCYYSRLLWLRCLEGPK